MPELIDLTAQYNIRVDIEPYKPLFSEEEWNKIITRNSEERKIFLKELAKELNQGDW